MHTRIPLASCLSLSALAALAAPACHDDAARSPDERVQSALTQSLQAEDAVFSQAVFETIHAGYTGNGYVNTNNVAGSYVEWRVSVPAAIPTATLGFRYALDTGSRTASLRVNGVTVVSSLSFAATGAWTNWGVRSQAVALAAGTNVIRLTCTSSTGCPNLDRMNADYDDPRKFVDGFFTAPATSTFILRSGSLSSPPTWRYTFTTPPATWIQPTFSASSWATGSPGFGFGQLGIEDVQRTAWAEPSPDIWARTTFSISSSADFPKVMLWGRWDDHIEVYLNGQLAFRETDTAGGYRYAGLTAAARAALKTGTNTLAVHVRDIGGSKYFDMGVFRNQALTDRPMSGFERPGLTAYANLVRRFMVEQGIPAGVLAVSKRDQLVVSRGIGWKDKAMTTTIAANAVVRLMSVDKPITKAAIRRIIDAGTFDPVSNRTITDDTAVFPVLAAHGLTPPPGMSVPPLVNQITIRHLLDHVSGISGHLDPQQLYAVFGITAAQSNLHHNVRWLYGVGPEFTPGSCPYVEGCYSSTGYMVLRYLIHVLKGDLITYLRNVVLAPVGTNEVYLSYERLENRLPSEPGYMTFVEPYDRWIFLENFTALSASAPALVKFARGYHLPLGTRLINPATGGWGAPDNGTWVAAGGGEGLVSWVIQRLHDEVNIAIVFPLAGGFTPHPEATTPSVDIVQELDQLTNTIPESAWN